MAWGRRTAWATVNAGVSVSKRHASEGRDVLQAGTSRNPKLLPQRCRKASFDRA